MEIISNGSSKKSFVSLLMRKLFFLFYLVFWYRDFLARMEKVRREKWKIDFIFRITIRHFEPYLSMKVFEGNSQPCYIFFSFPATSLFDIFYAFLHFLGNSFFHIVLVIQDFLGTFLIFP